MQQASFLGQRRKPSMACQNCGKQMTARFAPRKIKADLSQHSPNDRIQPTVAELRL
jgi:hypothetical protein